MKKSLTVDPPRKDALLSSGQQRSISPPKLPSDLSSSLMKPVAKKGQMTSKAPVAPASKQPPAPALATARSKEPEATGKGPPPHASLSSDDSGVYIRGGGFEKAGDFDGKFVIPKILLESGTPRGKGADSSDRAVNRVSNAAAYEMFDQVDTLGQKPGESSVRDRAPGRYGVASGRALKGRDRGQRSDSRRSIPSAKSSGGSEKKQQRKFIRSLLRADEYGEPAFCPRAGVLSLIWALFIIVVALLLKYVLAVDFREPSIEEFDNGCFMKVYLTEDI